MAKSSFTNANPYLTGSIPRLFLKTAAPVTLVMLINGLFTVIDALFLGIFVGPDALTAVTLMFPLFMLIVGLSTLVGTGMASILSRQLGAGHLLEANRTLTAATLLSLAISGMLAILFMLFGDAVIKSAADNNINLATMGHSYISMLVYCSPLAFFLTVQSDALRCEGHTGPMAVMAVGATLLNIGFNYLLIKILGLGVFGSALGTVLAQLIAVALVFWFRFSGKTRLGVLSAISLPVWKGWKEIVILGIPASLTFIGITIISSIIIYSLQVFAADSYSSTVAAYGVMSRIGTFTFLPLLGFSLATQSIVGNNVGADRFQRSNASLKLALTIAVSYCLLIELVLISHAETLGALFVSDPLVIAEVARILPVTMATFFVFGPVMILSGYFQALGDAPRAALLGLAKPYLFAIPITLVLPHAIGEWGIWLAGPASDAAMLALTAILLIFTARRTGVRFGVFLQPPVKTTLANTPPD